MTTTHWKDAPDDHDYPAARAYLSLLVDPGAAKALVKALQKTTLAYAKAKDLLRASRLELLPADDPEVRQDLKSVRDGGKLSPVLLVRGAQLNHHSSSPTDTTEFAPAITSTKMPTSPTTSLAHRASETCTRGPRIPESLRFLVAVPSQPLARGNRSAFPEHAEAALI